MPPITLHMVLARRIAAELGNSDVTAAEGAYLLGATAPDIRVLTRQDRAATHFFDLQGPDHQDSVAGFFAAYPHLADPASLNLPTRAFVGGYLTHLVFDEQYITTVYRRLFARHEALGGTLRANLMDRLLQFGLDRDFGDPEIRKSICDALAATVVDIEVGFIEPDTLERWRKVAADVAARAMDWDRMRAMVANHLRRSGVDEPEGLARFLDSLPELLNETMAYVTDERIRGYLERSAEAARSVLARYFGCA